MIDVRAMPAPTPTHRLPVFTKDVQAYVALEIEVGVVDLSEVHQQENRRTPGRSGVGEERCVFVPTPPVADAPSGYTGPLVVHAGN
jgi:hypothetical protein